jgi:predicted glycoside hydrolase/deacetylase ChbG (UPF0249 family)
MSFNEKLGFPPNAKLLIINADDFGMCYGQNIGTIRSIKEGLVSSCTLMMPCPWSLHAVHFLQEYKQVPFGIHLTFLSEYKHYRWGPLNPPQDVPTLVDNSGYFLPDNRIHELMKKVNLTELEKEFRTQIQKVFSYGLEPTHLDSHYNLHEGREDIFELTFNLAIEFGLALRVSKKSFIEKLQGMGYPTVDKPVTDSGQIKPEEVTNILSQQLRDLPSGLNEWALHPGISSPELEAVMADPRVKGTTGTPQGRQADFNLITSQEFSDLVQKSGIEILSYRSLQKVWRKK